ncbi:MAG: hypothetical protein ACRERS_09310, partial [Methylococcales bacterium]
SRPRYDRYSRTGSRPGEENTLQSDPFAGVPVAILLVPGFQLCESRQAGAFRMKVLNPVACRE